jgi:hypothetical protein
MQTSFWNFGKASKIDILDEREPKHVKNIIKALNDQETMIETINRESYNLVGPDQALLCETVSPQLRMTFLLYGSIVSIFGHFPAC